MGQEDYRATPLLGVAPRARSSSSSRWRRFSTAHHVLLILAATACGLLLAGLLLTHRRSAAGPVSTTRWVLGMTSIAREQSYLPATLRSLACALAPNQGNGTAASDAPIIPTVLVLNGEVPPRKHVAFQALRSDSLLNSAVMRLTLLEMPELHVPLAAALLPNGSHSLTDPLFGDEPRRLWWRSKEALDTAYIMDAALQAIAQTQSAAPGQSMWYLHLQDDVRFAPGFLARLSAYVESLEAAGTRADIITLFSDLDAGRLALPYPSNDFIRAGFVALAFNASSAAEFSAHVRQHWNTKPVDFLFSDWMGANGKRMHVLYPNPVQHVGTTSSLHGKKQLRVSASFVPGQC